MVAPIITLITILEISSKALEEDLEIWAPVAVPKNFPRPLKATKEIISKYELVRTPKSRCIPLNVKKKTKINSSVYRSRILNIFFLRGLKLTTTTPMVIVESNLSNSIMVAILKQDSSRLRITTIYVPSVSLLMNLEMILNKNPNKEPKAIPPKMVNRGWSRDEYTVKDSERIRKLAMEAAMLKFIIPKASSKAVIPMMVLETSPSALYSCFTARVAEGSVGLPNEARRRERGMNKVNSEPPGTSIMKGVTARRPKKRIRKTISDSKSPIEIIPFPNRLILE